MCQKINTDSWQRRYNRDIPFVPRSACEDSSDDAMPRSARWLVYVAVALLGVAAWAAVKRSIVVEPEEPTGPTRKFASHEDRYRVMDRIAALFAPLPAPEPGDWLSKYHEHGQTFDQYVTDHKRPIHDEYAEIHVVVLGEMTPSQFELFDRTAEFLEIYFGMKVRKLDPIPLDDLPPNAQRPRDDGKHRQLLTTYLMHDVLAPRRSDEAAALLGFVADDLWGGPSWNWLYGQASIGERVGIWSLFRNGDPDGDDAERTLCLLRTLKTAAHETGHMLGMPHCIAYSCCMNGSNHREESDAKPLELCPECLAKAWWTCGVDPLERNVRLRNFAVLHGLKAETKFWQSLESRLQAE